MAAEVLRALLDGFDPGLAADLLGGVLTLSRYERGRPMPFADPEKARSYQREYRRVRRGGDGCTTPGTTPLPTELRLRTAADVLALLEEQAGAVRADERAGALEKARAVGFLASVALRAIEAGNLAARIEMLEAILKQRSGDSKR
jgi:hypothetical protein